MEEDVAEKIETLAKKWRSQWPNLVGVIDQWERTTLILIKGENMGIEGIEDMVNETSEEVATEATPVVEPVEVPVEDSEPVEAPVEDSEPVEAPVEEGEPVEAPVEDAAPSEYE